MAPDSPAAMPALENTRSMLPNSLCAFSANCTKLSTEVTSQNWATAAIPSSPSASSVSCSAVLSTSPTTIIAPRRPNEKARERPTPLAPPVITATLSLKSCIVMRSPSVQGKTGEPICETSPGFHHLCKIPACACVPCWPRSGNHLKDLR